MAISAQVVFEEAMQLSEEERGELIRNLLDSYGSPHSPVEHTDEVWLMEIERRARAAQAGERGIPWEDVRSAIQRRLAGG
jgi:putative addiction module component (TIGR02574 family)